MLAEIVLIGGGYLFGSLPFSVALARLSGLDISQEEDLHIALWHQAGKKAAILAGAVDFFKGVIVILIGFGLGISSIAVAFSGVTTVVGQMWPPPYGGHGEKGNAPGVAVVMTLSLVYGAYWALLSLIFFATGAALKYCYERRSTTSRETKDGGNQILYIQSPYGSEFTFGYAFGVHCGSSSFLAFQRVNNCHPDFPCLAHHYCSAAADC